MIEIKIYTVASCPACDQVKEFLYHIRELTKGIIKDVTILDETDNRRFAAYPVVHYVNEETGKVLQEFVGAYTRQSFFWKVLDCEAKTQKDDDARKNL